VENDYFDRMAEKLTKKEAVSWEVVDLNGWVEHITVEGNTVSMEWSHGFEDRERVVSRGKDLGNGS